MDTRGFTVCQGGLTVSACNTIGYLACWDARGTACAKTLVGDKQRWNGFERENSCRDFLFDVPFSPFSPFSTWHTILFNKELLKTGVNLYMPACLQTEELSCSTDSYHSCLQTICHSWDIQLHCQHCQDSCDWLMLHICMLISKAETFVCVLNADGIRPLKHSSHDSPEEGNFPSKDCTNTCADEGNIIKNEITWRNNKTTCMYQHTCVFFVPSMCASWHPPLGQWKTFLLCAFGLCGRRQRLIVPQAHRRRAHSCHTYTQSTHSKETFAHRDPSQSQITQATATAAWTLALSNAHTHSGRASQRAACQEGEHGWGSQKGSQESVGGLPLTQRQHRCQGAEQKKSLDLPPQSGWLQCLILSQ